MRLTNTFMYRDLNAVASKKELADDDATDAGGGADNEDCGVLGARNGELAHGSFPDEEGVEGIPLIGANGAGDLSEAGELAPDLVEQLSGSTPQSHGIDNVFKVEETRLRLALLVLVGISSSSSSSIIIISVSGGFCWFIRRIGSSSHEKHATRAFDTDGGRRPVAVGRIRIYLGSAGPINVTATIVALDSGVGAQTDRRGWSAST